MSDLKMNRLLNTIDEWASASGLDDEVAFPYRLEPTIVDKSASLELKFATDDIRTVLWATGFRPDFSWLELPVFDRKGRIRHDGGVVDMPGLYLLGMQFMRRRKSALIGGVGSDAQEVSDHLAAYLGVAGESPPPA